MENISITKLPLTILDKLNFLKKDYVGLYFDVNVILRLILGFSITAFTPFEPIKSVRNTFAGNPA